MASIAFVPVSPLRTSTGALATLVRPLGSEEAATPAPLADAGAALSNFNIVADAMSISAAATLGVGTIFKGAVSANEQAFYFDAMTYTDQYEERAGSGKAILATRWGIGLRILLRVSNVSASASLNFGLVGAAVELGQARARYEIVGVGLGADVFAEILSGLSGLGSFTYKTYLELSGPVSKNVAKYIKTNATTLTPVPVAVALASPIDPISGARPIYYAMTAISAGLPLSRALERADVALDRDAIAATYFELGVGQDPTAAPDREAIERARDWLHRDD